MKNIITFKANQTIYSQVETWLSENKGYHNIRISRIISYHTHLRVYWTNTETHKKHTTILHTY